MRTIENEAIIILYVIGYVILFKAVNEVDGTRPPNIQYMSMRQFAPEVKLSTEPGFMVCCDCKDNCSVSVKLQNFLHNFGLKIVVICMKHDILYNLNFSLYMFLFINSPCMHLK